MKIDKYIFDLLIITIIAIAIQDIYIDQFSPYRYYVIWTQFTVIVLGFFSLLAFFNFKSNFQQNYFKWYLSFLMMLSFYAIFSPYFFEIFPRILFTLLPAFTFYQVGKAGLNVEKRLQCFIIVVLPLSLYQLYLGFYEHTILYGDLIERADNTGYTLLGLMLIISLLRYNKLNLALISIAYIGALLSLKRGAMLASSIFYVFYIINNRDYFLAKKKFINITLGFGIVLSVICLVIYYYDFLAYRFAIDALGSGRIIFYNIILNGWYQAPLLNQVFGFGFFATMDYLYSTYSMPIYAHSDWLEILYDHGLVGVMIFLGLMITLYNVCNDVKKYIPHYYLIFWGLLIVFFIKSLISGTYMTKFDIYTYSFIGYILGFIQHKKNVLAQYVDKAMI